LLAQGILGEDIGRAAGEWGLVSRRRSVYSSSLSEPLSSSSLLDSSSASQLLGSCNCKVWKAAIWGTYQAQENQIQRSCSFSIFSEALRSSLPAQSCSLACSSSSWEHRLSLQTTSSEEGFPPGFLDCLGRASEQTARAYKGHRLEAHRCRVPALHRHLVPK